MAAASIILPLLGLFPGSVFAAIELASSDQWDDFTNNFATDLAPIITLFGEQATKQFLSESTSFWENILFGVAPLGIITALVSVIRVYGNASLKAFIGRAQEAPGQAEAELCSSTSDDVCELWSNDGICRVFGRPKIIEFFYDKSCAQFQSKLTSEDGIHLRPPHCGIHIPEDVLDSASDHVVRSSSNWAEHAYNKTSVEKGLAAETGVSAFAPHPNLSLNIGIKSFGKRTLVGTVFAGILLQSSFFGFSTWITFYRPDLYDDAQPPQLWSFILAMTGTGMLVSGMTLCALLIDQRSIERRFSQPRPYKTITFWLQPGGQRIGDQLFNTFSYCEKRPKYVTSWKADENSPRYYASPFILWVTLVSTSLGFICQFIGFRGLHGSITLYQLALTLVMSIIRAGLRSRRLGRENNGLEVLGRDVEGHELDWQAIHLEQQANGESDDTDSTALTECDKVSNWYIFDYPSPITTPKDPPTPTHEASSGVDIYLDESGTALPRIAGFRVRKGKGLAVDPLGSANEALKWAKHNELDWSSETLPNPAVRVMLYRSRLAYLTDDALKSAERRWDSETRRLADALQQAIQGAAEYMFSNMKFSSLGWNEAQALLWSTTVTAEGYTPTLESLLPIHFGMFREAGRWSVSKWQLEAVLGLWHWSLSELQRVQAPGSHRLQSAKVFALANDAELSDLRAMIRLWVTQSHQIMADKIRVPTTLLTGDENSPMSKRSFSSLTNPLRAVALQRAGPQSTESDSLEAVILSIKSSSGLLELLAQDIFAIFVSRMADILTPLDSIQSWTPESATATLSVQNRRVGNTAIVSNLHTSSLADIFVSAGLGSPEDALFSILPPFFARGKLPSLRTVATTLFLNTKSMRYAREFNTAERILLRLTAIEEFAEQAVRELCKLYRKALGSRDASERRFGESAYSKPWSAALSEMQQAGDGIDKASRRYDMVWEYFKSRKDPEDWYHRHAEELQEYELGAEFLPTALTLSCQTNLAKVSTQSVRLLVRWAIEHDCQELIEDLWEGRHGLVNQELGLGSLQSTTSPPLVLAIDRHTSIETIETLLDWPGVNVDVQDREGRTPLFVATEKGAVKTVEMLLKRGVDVDLATKQGQTPLSQAISDGKIEIIRLLIAARAETYNARDADGRPMLHLAVETPSCGEEIFELLLRGNAEPDRTDSAGTTALIRAAKVPNSTALRILLKYKARVNIRDLEGRTALFHAVDQSHKAVAEELLRNGAEVNLTPPYNPLHRAVENRDRDMVELLLQNHATIFPRGEHGDDFIFEVVQMGHYGVIELLLVARKKSLGHHLQNVPDLSPALPIAIEASRPDLVRLLLDHGAKPSCKELMGAVRSRNCTMVKMLLKAGNDRISTDQEHQDLLLEAIQQWHGREKDEWQAIKDLLATRSILRMRGKKLGLLFESGANVNAVNGGEHGTALRAAVYGWDDDIMIEFLLRKGADINAHAGASGTALHAAIEHGRGRVFEVLLARGADMEARDEATGRTALLWAVEFGREEMARRLVEANANLEATDKAGATSLLIAVEKGFCRIAKMLLHKGADVERCLDGDDRTPLIIAAERFDEEMMEVLLDAENKPDVNARGGLYGNALTAVRYWGSSISSNSRIEEKLLEAGAK
ncbi:hypothetical protein B0T21DRAFT_410905 [Apiosordaria backusii]|uniref:Ankyrin repeat protein n=1 Tax=Apiosordaria backusii TaxID=314023 RepID=A0AA40BNF2_9PEZI|nr:hypothetical protein B0T21DRAFT_410905 [Apiosordaria backusii]